MQVRERVRLPALSPTQVLIEVHCIGVNPVETYIRSGAYAALPALPFTPGFDACGVIRELGSASLRGPVGELRVGMRVWVCRSVTGTYATHCVCEASSICAMPDEGEAGGTLSDEQGAGVGVPCLTAALALFEHARVQPGERVLVHGASGAVGLACVQLGAAHGCEVWGTASTQEGKAAVSLAGARRVFGHATTDLHAMLDAHRTGASSAGASPASAGHAGVQVVIEMLANINLALDAQLVGPRGRIVVVGNRGELAFNPRSLMAKDASVLGMSLMNATHEPNGGSWARAMRTVDAALRAGTLRPVVSRVLPLSRAWEAHDAVMQGGKVGKIVLDARV